MSANILKYLRTHGEQLDADISKALKVPKAQLDKQLTDLLSAGEIICCHVTRYNGDKKIEGMSYRLSAHVPPRAPAENQALSRRLLHQIMVRTDTSEYFVYR